MNNTLKHNMHSLVTKYTKVLAMTLMAMLTTLSSCSDKDEPLPDDDGDKVEQKDSKRTVLVYMVATNDLAGFDQSDLREMQTAAAQGDIKDGRLLVYHAANSGLVLKEIKADGIDTLKVYDKSKLSVSIDRMREVVADMKELAPASDYGLVLWSHASGWLQDGIDDTYTKGYRSYGNDNYNKMNITSLSLALEDAGFSYIYFDCCYMGSVEVMYEMRHCAPYMIVSAAEDPADGMPYDLNMPHLFDTDSDLAEACKAMAKTTFDSYNDVFVKGDCPCTMAVVNTDRVEALADVTRRVYEQATTTFNSEYTYQKYTKSVVCNYYDLEQYVESICLDPALMAEWRDIMSQTVIYAEATPWIWASIQILRYSGLSTNILANKLTASSNNYNTLSWYADVASKLFK